MADDVRLLTVGEVADLLAVPRMSVYRMVHEGDLPAIRFGRSFRVPEPAVLAARTPGSEVAGRSA